MEEVRYTSIYDKLCCRRLNVNKICILGGFTYQWENFKVVFVKSTLYFLVAFCFLKANMLSILTQGNESSEFFRFQWEFQWENDQKKNKMAKDPFSGVQDGSQSVYMGVLGGVFVLKSGLRILTRTPEVPFLVPPKTP